jgi:hypothetical protein
MQAQGVMKNLMELSRAAMANTVICGSFASYSRNVVIAFIVRPIREGSPCRLSFIQGRPASIELDNRPNALQLP